MIVFTKYSRLGASSRVRFYKYLKFFDNPTINNLKIYPLFDDYYLKNLYLSNSRSKIKIILLYISRFFYFFSSLLSKQKIIWIEKELFPHIPIPIELIFKLFNKKIIFDYDDAVFHNYDSSKISFLYKLKFKAIAKYSDVIFSGNEYLSSYFEKLGAKRVIYIPTVIDIDEYKKESKDKNNNKIKIGWIGSPSTQSYLKVIDGVITELQKKFNIDLVLIGVSEKLKLDSNFQSIIWSEKNEIKDISNFDIGIMPLFENDFEKGKCGYKIIQYFACKIPVVASPVGVNCTLIEQDNGFLCKTPQEWSNALEQLIKNEELRKRLGNSGYNKVNKFFTYQSQVNNIISVINNL
ncbi:glycosyltransferase [Providencia rettgeri]|nr:glycosyltransferase [Providencia rettgeri]EJD6644549.1 glycosyltransferase [Providencia rettgeri]ELL9154957.1 glycosyltransferase [Providencia rettgeri]ELR5050289.1 glycosyltransferase [Providencia rettgeri]ELR5063426.1 glycosyltransferase [Providencia rettgeri]